MERIKADEPTTAEIKAEREALLAKPIAKPKPKAKPKPAAEQTGVGDVLWRLCYLYALRDKMLARFGWREWMDGLPPLESSGVAKDEDGLYRPCSNTRVTCS